MVPDLEDHYAALGVDPTASVDEIKSAFRQAALKLHPDKQSGSEFEFVRVQRAWDTLSDPVSRAAYDQARAIAAAKASVHITETVAASEMELGLTEDGEAMLSWPCRCGGAFSLLESELEPGGFGDEIAVPCSTCSLHVAVVNSDKS